MKINQKKINLFFLFFIVFFAYAPRLEAQTYTDNKPKYQQFQDYYIIDKITYTKDRTIIYFRFVGNHAPVFGVQNLITYYSPRGSAPWMLKKSGENNSKPIKLIEIKNIAENGKILYKEMPTEEVTLTQRYLATYTCEIHFPKLPTESKFYDLIEGWGNENSKNSFNAFKIKFKDEKDPELGSLKDQEKRLAEFNKRNGLKTPKPEVVTKPEPKPEVVTKPEPKPEVVIKPEPKPEVVIKPDSIVESGKITIVFDDSRVRPISSMLCDQYLDWVVSYLKAHPNEWVDIIGHADLGDDEASAQELGLKRAQYIAEILKTKKINPNQLRKIESRGKTEPVLGNFNGRNRRVNLFIRK
jgi:outer membrane protein OmpA-like peptidoglycan-associated protein